MIDLGLIVADKTMGSAVAGILGRHRALGIRSITWKTIVLPGRDGRVRTAGPDQLTLLHGQIRHGIVMLDFEGSGAKGNALELEAELNRQLQTVWRDEARAIVIDPEVDAWIWGANNLLKQIIDVPMPDLRGWNPRDFHSIPMRNQVAPGRPSNGCFERSSSPSLPLCTAKSRQS